MCVTNERDIFLTHLKERKTVLHSPEHVPILNIEHTCCHPEVAAAIFSVCPPSRHLSRQIFQAIVSFHSEMEYASAALQVFLMLQHAGWPPFLFTRNLRCEAKKAPLNIAH